MHAGVDVPYTRDSSSVSVVDAVRTGHLDIAFAFLPASLPDGVGAHDPATHPAALICRRDRRLAGRRRLALRTVADELLLGAVRGSVWRASVDRAFAGFDGNAKVPFEVNDPRHAGTAGPPTTTAAPL